MHGLPPDASAQAEHVPSMQTIINYLICLISKYPYYRWLAITAIVLCDYWPHNDRQRRESSLISAYLIWSGLIWSGLTWYGSKWTIDECMACLHKRCYVWPINHYYVCASKAVSLHSHPQPWTYYCSLFELVNSALNFIIAWFYGLLCCTTVTLEQLGH